MKTLTSLFLVLFAVSFSVQASSNEPEKVLEEMVLDISNIRKNYSLKTEALYLRDKQIDLLLMEKLSVEK